MDLYLLISPTSTPQMNDGIRDLYKGLKDHGHIGSDARHQTDRQMKFLIRGSIYEKDNRGFQRNDSIRTGQKNF
jgi:hypothetical protein